MTHFRRSTALLFGLCLSAALCWHPHAAHAQTTTRISVTPAGLQGDADSSRPSISSDGRYVAFYSAAGNLVTGDLNLASDVFVKDRQTAQLVCVSVDDTGQIGNGASTRPSISANGRFVAFFSDASSLVPGDTNVARDVFVHDRDGDGDGLYDEPGAIKTVRVSVSTSGVQGSGGEGDLSSSRPSMSPDGRYVAFFSVATTLVSGDFNGLKDAFLHDRDLDGNGIHDEAGAGKTKTVRISVSSAGVEGDGDSSIPVVSADGRYVSFESLAANLVAGDTNAEQDVFIHDRDTDQDGLMDEPGAIATKRISTSTAGAQANGRSNRPAFSDDGRYLVYYGDANNLVAGDTNQHCTLDPFGQLICGPADDVFLYDRDTDGDGIYDEPGAVKTLRVSVSSAGAQANDESQEPDISGNGRFVTYWTSATNLVAGDTNATKDVMLHDRDADNDGILDEIGAISTTRISVSSAGAQANAESKRPSLNTDGRFVAFRSTGSNLVSGDTNLAEDVFVRDTATTCPSSFAYGVSTPACAGAELSSTLSCPQSGESTSFQCTNAPPLTFGFLVVGFGKKDPGIPVHGLTLQIDPFAPYSLKGAATNGAGLGTSTLFVPASASTIHVYCQFIWLGSATCGGTGTLSSSDALDVVFL